MVCNILEMRKSRDGNSSLDGQTTIDYTWRVSGSNELSEIGPTVEAVRPNHIVDPVWSTKLIPVRNRWRQVGHLIYDYTISYGNANTQQQLRTGEMRFGFTTVGGTTHITRSIDTSGVWLNRNKALGAPNPPNWFNPNPMPDPPGTNAFSNFINVTIYEETLPEGIDVITRQHEWWVEYAHETSLLTTQFINSLFLMTGTVNNASFYGRAAGELLFLGADGEISASGVTNSRVIRYNFSRRPNQSNVIIPLPRRPDVPNFPHAAIRIPFVEGWDYVWLRTMRDIYLFELNGIFTTVDVPTQAVVERIYPRTNYINLGIGVGFI